MNGNRGVYPPKETLEELYYGRKLSQREIAKLLACSRMKIRRAFRKYAIKPRTLRGGLMVKDYSEVYRDKADLTPSPDLAYVLGVIKGDGSVSIYRKSENPRAHAYKITLGNVDRPFADSFKKALGRIGVKARIYQYGGRWYVDACSKRLAKWVKSLTLNELEEMLRDERLAREFIRGFYESEGGYAKIWKKVHGCGFWDYRINITNTNFELMQLVRKLLLRFGFNPKMYEHEPSRRGRKRSYRLWIWGKANTQKFVDLFSPVIKNALHIWVCKKEW